MDTSTAALRSLLTAAPQEALTELCARHDLPSDADARDIAAAICADGGSSVANFFRGGGVSYAEVVRDVADQLGVPGRGTITATEALEQAVLDSVWQKYEAKLAPEELADLATVAERVGRSARASRARGAAVRAAVPKVTAQVLLATVGRQMFWSLLRTQVLPRLGVATAARMALAGPAAVLGPIGWALSGAMVVYEIDKPALRKTLPTVLQIAVLRGGL